MNFNDQISQLTEFFNKSKNVDTTNKKELDRLYKEFDQISKSWSEKYTVNIIIAIVLYLSNVVRIGDLLENKFGNNNKDDEKNPENTNGLSFKDFVIKYREHLSYILEDKKTEVSTMNEKKILSEIINGIAGGNSAGRISIKLYKMLLNLFIKQIKISNKNIDTAKQKFYDKLSTDGHLLITKLGITGDIDQSLLDIIVSVVVNSFTKTTPKLNSLEAIFDDALSCKV